MPVFILIAFALAGTTAAISHSDTKQKEIAFAQQQAKVDEITKVKRNGFIQTQTEAEARHAGKAAILGNTNTPYCETMRYGVKVCWDIAKPRIMAP